MLICVGVGCLPSPEEDAREFAEKEQVVAPTTTGQIIDLFSHYNPAYLMAQLRQLSKDGWVRRQVERPGTGHMVWLLTNLNVDPGRPWIAEPEPVVAS